MRIVQSIQWNHSPNWKKKKSRNHSRNWKKKITSFKF